MKKEQKPAEQQDYSGLNDFERAIHRGFLCAGVENVPVNIIKETAQDCLAHLPVEWSEEDEEMLEYIIGDVNDAMQLYTTRAGKDMANKEIAWLKSLKPQPKQEWSKEETKDLVHILKVLDDCYAYGKHDLSKTDHDNLTSTIKSLHPSWKPSEEQMEALEKAIIKAHSTDEIPILTELRQQLKKLM